MTTDKHSWTAVIFRHTYRLIQTVRGGEEKPIWLSINVIVQSLLCSAVNIHNAVIHNTQYSRPNRLITVITITHHYTDVVMHTGSSYGDTINVRYDMMFNSVKCIGVRRKRRLLTNSATVAVFGDSRRNRATIVSSVDRALEKNLKLKTSLHQLTIISAHLTWSIIDLRHQLQQQQVLLVHSKLLHYHFHHVTWPGHVGRYDHGDWTTTSRLRVQWRYIHFQGTLSCTQNSPKVYNVGPI